MKEKIFEMIEEVLLERLDIFGVYRNLIR